MVSTSVVGVITRITTHSLAPWGLKVNYAWVGANRKYIEKQDSATPTGKNHTMLDCVREYVFYVFFQIKKHVFYGFYGNDVSKSRSESAIVLLSVISCEPQNFHAPFFRDFRGQVSKRENKGAQILCAHYGDYYHRQYHGRYQVLKTQNLRAANMYPRKKPQYKKARENLGVFSISPSK